MLKRLPDILLLCCIAVIAAPFCLIQVPEAFLWPILDRRFMPRLEGWINSFLAQRQKKTAGFQRFSKRAQEIERKAAR